ncbi:LPD7 domain-containing protein [Hydrogenophaga sp. RWCD_12]|uniref:LPD7 domain-containing protein n=1 Tax=Hydrogenophaga sp. RWCD_12 TaxID=3391190 RepID=UPI0039849999
MDEKSAPANRVSRSASDANASLGGTVEPADRARIAIRTFQTPEPDPGERFELRDPFADLTYRSDRYQDILAKADQLGANRFVVLDARGQKSFVHKIDGQWQREPTRDAQTGPTHPKADSNAIPPPAKEKHVETSDHSALRETVRMNAQAERGALVARVEASLNDRYIIKRAPVTLGDVSIGLTEYRFRGDTSRVAFTESTFRLATDTNSPSVARSMVDVAEARNWKALRVSGNEDFKRMVWLEASVRGVKTLGYEPNPGDLEVLKREREARQVNRIEPARDAISGAAAAPAEKSSARGGRRAVLAAIEAVLVAKKVPEKQRAAVMAAATEKLAQRIRDGQVPKVKVYDKAAQSLRPVVVPTPEMQRSRDRAAVAPVR